MFGGVFANSSWSLLLVAVGYGALQTSWILSDARFQATLQNSTRATVSSFRAFLSGMISVLALAGIGALAEGDDPTVGLLFLSILLALAGLAVKAWVPHAGSR